MTRPRVLVAGAGVGALEAVLAVRERVGDIVEIELVAPDDEFVYRAMTVAEPFGYTRAQRVPLSQLWRSHRVRHRRDAVVAVDAGAHSVTLRSGDTLGYDALVLAVGARREAWLLGAVTFSGATSVPAVQAILTELESGAAASVLFVAPPESRWTMPVYELALLTAAWCADRHVVGVELTVSMTEDAPLAAFGESASRLVRGILGNRGIRLRPDAPPAEYDAVVAMPRLVSHAIRGVPAAADGFIAVGDHGEVAGMEGVYAVGDAAAHPVKQGGLAAQQADAAADAIARAFGLGPKPDPARPVLRGLLLTGVTPAFLRKDADGDVVAAFDALWWPPTKVAGRFLGPYLADSHAVGKAGELENRPPPIDRARAAEDRLEVRRLAVSMAEADARLGDHRSARHWLQTVEWLDGALSDDLAAAARPSDRTTDTAELTALDTTFLELEDADASAHMHIGAVLVFEGPAPTHAELVRRVNDRLPALPRFRQRLDDRAVRPLHRPRWTEIVDFDPTDHVRTAALPGGRSDAELLAWSGDYYSHRLDRCRPLWELVLIDGMAGGRWALATKTHHCMADGIGSLDAARLFADGAEHLPVQPHAGPGQGTVERLRSALGLADRDAPSPRRRPGGPRGAATDPGGAGRHGQRHRARRGHRRAPRAALESRRRAAAVDPASDGAARRPRWRG